MRNVGTVDRGVRAVVALTLIGIGAILGEWPAALLGIAVGATAVAGWCPLYRVYGLCTVGGVRRTCGPEDPTCSLPGAGGR